jgi:NAD(P)-dependent dehydrogenase (short-subunit alcohol dehydrogenase family)
MSLKQLFNLTGRTALVSGGSRGLGLQIAEALGEQGARVVLVARKAAELDAAKAHLAARVGIDALPLVCDLSDVAAIPPLVERAIAAAGPIDILVNNAGTTWGAPTLEHPLEAWNKVVTLNLTAMFVLSQEVGRRCMVPRRRGKIINIASILGLVGGGDRGRAPTLAYNTTKGGVVSFTRSLAVEWAQYAINVNAIAPGFFPTKMTQGVLETAGDAIADRTPLRRIGGAEDLKGLVALFASDAGAFITGQIVAVDGGTTAASGARRRRSAKSIAYVRRGIAACRCGQ